MPSDPLLQGARGSSRSSSELSSSEGVWLVRKWKENEGKWERKAEKKQEPRTFINGEDPLTVSSLGAFIAKPLYKITKITYQILLQWGQKRKKTKRVKKQKRAAGSQG